MAGKDGRSNCWAFFLYPDSMPAQSFEYLYATGLPVYVSPLHDRDVMTLEDVIDARQRGITDCVVGDPKKPHFHCMIRFSSNKSSRQVLFMLKPLGVSYVLQLGTSESAEGMGWRGYARYLCHLDNPEKAQYNRDDVKVFHAPEYRFTAALNLSSERAWKLEPIFDFLRDNEIYSWAFFIDYCRHERADWFELAIANTAKIQAYMKSMTWEYFREPVLNKKLMLVSGDTTTPTHDLKSKSLPQPQVIPCANL